MIIKEEYRDILGANPHLSHLYLFNDIKGFQSLRRFVEQLSDITYDYVLDIHRGLRSWYIRKRLRSKNVLLIEKYLLRRWSLLYLRKYFYRSITNISRAYLDAAQPLNIDGDDKTEFYLKSEDRKTAGALLSQSEPENPVITMCIGAGFHTKRWPVEKFSALAHLLLQDKNVEIVLLGGPSDRDRGRQMTESVNSSILNLCGELSLGESAAVIEQSHLVVSNDSGLMHTAVAFDRPLVALFGSTTEELGFFPYHPKTIVLQKQLSCRPCSHNGRNQCPQTHFRCMRDISPEEVFNTVSYLLTQYVYSSGQQRDAAPLENSL